jgi:hypothetical protein
MSTIKSMPSEPGERGAHYGQPLDGGGRGLLGGDHAG